MSQGDLRSEGGAFRGMIPCAVGSHNIWTRLSEGFMREGFLVPASMGQRDRLKEGGTG